MSRDLHVFRCRSTVRATLGRGVVAAALVTWASVAWTDDRDLLKTEGSTPYVFVQLDSSSSMNLGADNRWLPGGADNPASKLYMAKKALYEVFESTDYNFGFSTFNQDALRVRAKHWLYRPSLPAGWPLSYPDAADLWTFGRHFDPADPGAPPPAEAVAGSCSEPLDVDDPVERQMLNSFAKLHLDVAASQAAGVALGAGPTRLWLRENASVYRLTVENDILDPARHFGAAELPARLRLERLDPLGSCAAPVFVATPFDADVPFTLEGEFLMDENGVGFDGLPSVAERHAQDRLAGFWDYSDAEAASDCGDATPFSGKGWEGNYDFDAYADAVTGLPVPFPPGIPSSQLTDADGFPIGCAPGDDGCYDLLTHPTQVDLLGRSLDRGDVLPFNWLDDHRDDLLSRLAPNRLEAGAPDFGVAAYFTDIPDATTGYLRLEDESQRPVLAVGGSPNAKAINDFHCWYSEQRPAQCQDAPYPSSWEESAQTQIANLFGCVEPFFIVVTDGENSCGGESPLADVAALKSQAGVKTWVLVLGPEGSADEDFAAVAATGSGEVVYVADEEDLREELEKIQSVIEEHVRTFASAVVPTVQATSSDTVYLTRFLPLEDTAFWSGHVSSFLKPLPLDPLTGKPDLGHERHLWDAGEVLKTQVSPLDPLGPAETQRRVYYTQTHFGLLSVVQPGEWPASRRLLEPDPSVDPGDPPTQREKDLWSALGLPPCLLPLPFCVNGNRDETAAILDDLYAMKSATVGETEEEIEYILGDTYHSDPVILGGPSNRSAFLDDRHGYREFARKHEHRRKVLLVGSNDGMLHAFDAGTASVESGETVRFDEGTGRELFAYVPRQQVLATAERVDSTSHVWGVDGGINAADVYIDPSFDGAPDPDDREWRTVAVTGLRRGGFGYTALDLTHPDELEEVTLPSGEIAFVPSDDDSLPDCADQLGNGSLGCDEEVTYAAPLWEYDDTLWLPGPLGESLDEDLDALGELVGNGLPDLADGWSRPNIGRIRICTGTLCQEDPNGDDDLEDRYVAIFGGGLPEQRALWNAAGNFLYIVDIETGRALAKHFLLGSAPSEPAAVDTDADGYLDRVYIGTTLGLLYRLDLGPDSTGTFPTLGDVLTLNVAGLLQTVQRIVDREPRIVFSASGLDLPDPTELPTSLEDIVPPIRPIFFPPRVLHIASLDKVALVVGTGDREDLWSDGLLHLGELVGNPEGRIYAFVDDSSVDPVTGSPSPILTENDLIDLGEAGSESGASGDLLLQGEIGERGWYLRLEPGERVLNTPLSLAGVTFVVTYLPGDVEAGQCQRDGVSRLYGINTANANGLLFSATEETTRFHEVRDFVTRPFVEQAQTRNEPGEAGETTADDLDLGLHLEEVMEQLKELFPENCRFGNHRLDVKAVTSETGFVFVAPVPVCIVQQNWKQF